MNDTDIECELSYAYLHAICSHAGIAIMEASRAVDAQGIDAILRYKGRFSAESTLTSISVDVQLKATRTRMVERNGKIPFDLPIGNYDTLRSTSNHSPQLLIVYFLPGEKEQWLSHEISQLTLRKCAYWLSLYDAPTTHNRSKRRVQIPLQNYLSVDALRNLFDRFSREENISYEE